VLQEGKKEVKSLERKPTSEFREEKRKVEKKLTRPAQEGRRAGRGGLFVLGNPGRQGCIRSSHSGGISSRMLKKVGAKEEEEGESSRSSSSVTGRDHGQGQLWVN